MKHKNLIDSIKTRRLKLSRRIEYHDLQYPVRLHVSKYVIDRKLNDQFLFWHQAWLEEQINLNINFNFRFNLALRYYNRDKFILNRQLKCIMEKRQDLHVSAKEYLPIFKMSDLEIDYMGLNQGFIRC